MMPIIMMTFLYYFFLCVLFVICILKVVHLTQPALLPLLIGKWEVFSFWLLLCWFLAALFFFVSTYFKRSNLISKKTIMVLGLIFLIGFYLRAFAAPHTERLYFDEDIYLNIAQNIQSNNQALACNNGYIRFGRLHCLEPILNKEPDGWSFLLSLALNFARPEKAGRWLDIFLSSFSILLVFLIGREFLGERGGLWAAFIYALMPIPIKWAPTIEPDTAFTFFLLFSFWISVLQTKGMKLGYLLFPLLAFTVQFRPEGVLCLPIILFVLWVDDKGFFKERINLFFSGLFSILLIPYGIHLFSAKAHHWGSKGPVFSTQYFFYNLLTNLRFFVQPFRFPTIDIFLCALGFIYLYQFRTWKSKGLFCGLVLWFILFFSIYLFFYAGSYNYGVDIRFSLSIHPVLAVFSSAGVLFLLEWFDKKDFNFTPVMAGLLFTFLLLELPRISIIGQQGWQARADHNFITALARTLPENTVVFTHDPSELMAAGIGGIQTFRLDSSYLVQLLKEREIPYFYFDAWCSTPEFKDQCNKILAKFKLKPVAENKVQNQNMVQKLVLYKILGVRK